MISKGKSIRVIKKYQKRLVKAKKYAIVMRKKADVIVRGGHKAQRLGKKQEMDKPITSDEFKAKVIGGQTFYEARIQMKVQLQPGKPFKLKIKPEMQSTESFGSVQMGGFGYSVQPHHNNPSKIPKKESGDFNKPVAEESDEVGEIDVVGEILGENSSLSLRDLKQTILKITMVKILPPETQKMLRDLNLDLRPSLARCERIHGKNSCINLWGTMSVKKCPRGYERFGCCMCVLPCPSSDFVDVGNYCKKPKPYLTHLYGNLRECKKHNKLENDICQLFGVRGYTEKCDEGYSREGELNCRKDCPIGWPDDGSFCTKIGTVEKMVPSPWMPGDMALSEKSVKRKAEFERANLLKKEQKVAQKRKDLEQQLKNKGKTKIINGKKVVVKKGGKVVTKKVVKKKVVVKKAAPVKKFIRDL